MASVLKELALKMTLKVIRIAQKLLRVDKGVITDARFVYASNKIPSDVFFCCNQIHSILREQNPLGPSRYIFALNPKLVNHMNL